MGGKLCRESMNIKMAHSELHIFQAFARYKLYFNIPRQFNSNCSTSQFSHFSSRFYIQQLETGGKTPHRRMLGKMNVVLLFFRIFFAVSPPPHWLYGMTTMTVSHRSWQFRIAIRSNFFVIFKSPHPFIFQCPPFAFFSLFVSITKIENALRIVKYCKSLRV